MRLWMFCFVLMLSFPVFAGRISFNIDMSAPYITSESVNIKVSIKNFGDESAKDVLLTLKLPEAMQTNPIFVGDMNPLDVFEGIFKIQLKRSLLSGSYPVILMLEYKDINGYPFSVLSSLKLINKEEGKNKINVYLGSVSFNEYGIMKGRITNEMNKPIKVSVNLYTPKEIQSSGPSLVLLKPGETKELSFMLRNKGALLWSRYNVVLVAEYEDKTHHTVLAHSLAEITEKKPSSSQLPHLTLVILFILLIMRLRL